MSFMAGCPQPQSAVCPSGRVCPSPYTCAATQDICILGKCGNAACSPGWADCNMDPSDGCEANLHVDPKNCVGCGMEAPVTRRVLKPRLERSEVLETEKSELPLVSSSPNARS